MRTSRPSPLRNPARSPGRASRLHLFFQVRKVDFNQRMKFRQLIGKFRRSITLPSRVDANKVSASYRDGILTVTLPKAEVAKPKQIQVNVD